MRDATIRKIAMKELHLCKECCNRFYPSELLAAMKKRKLIY